MLKDIEKENSEVLREKRLHELREGLQAYDDWGYHAAISWYKEGMASIFLQDANSMLMNK